MPDNSANGGDPAGNIELDLLPQDGERALRELAAGNMVIARSGNDFLYIAELNGLFHMFTHTPGAAGGGQRQFPKNEKYTASVRKLAELSDAMYVCVFDRAMNLYGVLQSAEEGILSLFPGADRDTDADVEFRPWDKNSGSADGATEKPPAEYGEPGRDFPSENFEDLFTA
ncbi:MAG: hypothetical protein LBC28_04910 [Oscillospiraceae bacterium]|jgi:hypothetical protein|nr:hypothetical protein [Oscillospiraceae bacterium]